MKNNSKLVIISVIFVLLMLFVMPLTLLITINSISYSDQPSLDLIYELYGSRVIKQEFTSTGNFLNGIGMSIKNPNLVNKKQIEMKIYRNGVLERTSILNGFNIPDGAFVKFNFPAIESSKDVKFEIILSSPESNEKESLGIFLTKNGNTQLGNLESDKKIIDGKIALISYYRVSSKLGLIRYVFRTFVLRFLSDNLFAMFYIAIILSGSIYLLVDRKKH